VENETNVYLDECFPFSNIPSFHLITFPVSLVKIKSLCSGLGGNSWNYHFQDANAALEAMAMLESSGELDAERAGEVCTEVESMAQQDSHSSTSRPSSNPNAHLTRSKASPARRTIPARGSRRPMPDLETHEQGTSNLATDTTPSHAITHQGRDVGSSYAFSTKPAAVPFNHTSAWLPVHSCLFLQYPSRNK